MDRRSLLRGLAAAPFIGGMVQAASTATIHQQVTTPPDVYVGPGWYSRREHTGTKSVWYVKPSDVVIDNAPTYVARAWPATTKSERHIIQEYAMNSIFVERLGAPHLTS